MNKLLQDEGDMKQFLRDIWIMIITGKDNDIRTQDYKDNDRKAQQGEEHTQPELFKHFHSGRHNVFLQDFSITLINKTDS